MLRLFTIAILIGEMAFADVFNGPRFHMVVPLDRQHVMRDDYAGPLKIEIRNIPAEQIEEKLSEWSHDGLLPPFKGPLVVFVYVPSRSYVDFLGPYLTRTIRKEFAKALPNVTLNIRFKVVLQNMTTLRRFSYRMGQALGILNDQYLDEDTKRFVESAKEANQKALVETETFNERPKLDRNIFSPTMVRTIKLAFASARFTAVFAIRAAQTWGTLRAGTGPLLAGLSLTFFDPTVEFFNVMFWRELRNVYSQMPIFSDKFFGAGPTRFANLLFSNLAVQGVLRPLAMQSLGHVNNPSQVPAPTFWGWQSDLMSLALWNSVGAFAYTGYLNGTERLRQKGWLSAAQMDLINQINGLFDLASAIFSSNPAWHHLRFFTWGPQWTLYSLFALLGKVLPVRMDRVILVDSTIKDWQDIHDEQVTDASVHLETPEDAQTIKGIVQKAKPIGTQHNAFAEKC